MTQTQAQSQSQSQTEPQNCAAEFAPQIIPKPASRNTNATTTTTPQAQLNDILLNNFQIKKKRYRVLLNCDHLVWERLDAKRHGRTDNAKSQKETEYEKEELSHKAAYGSASHVVPIDDIIKVDNWQTKTQAARHTTSTSPVRSSGNEYERTPPSQAQTAPIPTPVAQYLMVHYAERLVKSPKDCNRWRVRTLTLFNTDPYIVRQWQTLLGKLLQQPERCRVQRLLVFINPYGGRKQALQQYERHCKPLFQLAGVDASCIVSQRANQIRDILLSHDLTPFDAVCCVGGDGTVAEVINGLLFRTMRDLGLENGNMLAAVQLPKPRLPVGIIPAGSTDTVAYSLHGTADVLTAAIHVVLGQRRGMDVCSVRNRQGIMRFCASVLSYGYLGDVAARSEKYRWMGTKRYEYTGVKAFLLNRGYEAEIRLLQLQEDEIENAATTNSESSTSASSSSIKTICFANCQRCNQAAPSPQATELQLPCDNINNYRGETTSSSSTRENKLSSIYNETEEVDNAATVADLRISNLLDCDSNQKALPLHMPAEQHNKQLEELATDNEEGIESAPADNASASSAVWKVIKGQFFMITGANITCACSRSPNGISRFNHLGDGCLELILVRSTSLYNNLRLLINTTKRNGDIRNLPFVEVYRTQRFSFRTPSGNTQEEVCSISGSCQPIVSPSESTDQDDDRISSWNCDGEVVNNLDITMSSHCQLVDVFMRGPHAYSKPVKSSVGCCCATDD